MTMAPTRRRRYEYDDDDDDDFVDELPWDHLWDYVLKDEEKSGKKQSSFRRNQQQDASDADSFLDYLFPVEEPPPGKRLSRSKQAAKDKKQISLQSSNKSKGSRRPFWRRNKRPKENEDMWDMGSMASSFEFFDEADTGAQQQKGRSKRRSQPQSRGARFSSGKQTQKSSTKGKVSSKRTSKTEKSSSLMDELYDTLDSWGESRYSSDDSRSEDCTRDDASSYESTEGPSISILTEEEDDSTIASRSEASSLLRGHRERDTAYNEVRLKFRADAAREAITLPPMEEEDDEEDASQALSNAFDERRDEVSNAFDERRDEVAQYDGERGFVKKTGADSGEEQLDMGPDWDMAPLVPSVSAAESQNNERSLAHRRENDAPLDNERSLAHRRENDAPLDTWNLDRSVPPPRSIADKLVCCGINNYTQEELNWSRRTGMLIHELNADELAAIFPKLRLVSDKNESKSRSEVIGNSNSFEKNFPAHLQLPSEALVAGSGPQSLFEYEYECGMHMNVTYAGFGPLPRTLIKVETHKAPPRSYERGCISYNKVLVQIEASTVSQTDCFIRRGEWWGKKQMSLPNTPGVDIVGKLYRIDKESSQRLSLKKGDRVISLTKRGGNSRYLSVNPDMLVKVPESVDPAEAACLVETYLTAFQLLHFGQSPGTRYRSTSLKGKTLLILGSMTPNMGRAMGQLSIYAGANGIYTTSKPKHFQQLTSLGFIPLSLDPVDWWEKLKGKVDMIISLGEEVTPLAYKLIKVSGEIVIATNSEVDLAPDVELSRQPSRLICTRGKAQRKSRTHFYDVYDEWDRDLGRCKKDLAHLVKLLELRVVAPYVLDRIPLGKVARAQEIVETKRLSGFLVCEPWLLGKSRAIRL